LPTTVRGQFSANMKLMERIPVRSTLSKIELATSTISGRRVRNTTTKKGAVRHIGNLGYPKKGPGAFFTKQGPPSDYSLSVQACESIPGKILKSPEAVRFSIYKARIRSRDSRRMSLPPDLSNRKSRRPH